MIKNFLKRRIIHGFDQWSKTYSEDVAPKLKKRGYSYEQLASCIVHALQPIQGATVAELGTGAGILGAAIKKIRPDLHIVGFDISAKMLEEASRTSAYSSLFRCDAEKIPFKSNYFEHVYTSFMFHSVLNEKIGLTELSRITSMKGQLALVDLFRRKNKIPILSKMATNVHSLRYEFGAPSNYHSVTEFADLAIHAGLNIIDTIKLDNSATGYIPVGGMLHYLLLLSK